MFKKKYQHRSWVSDTSVSDLWSAQSSWKSSAAFYVFSSLQWIFFPWIYPGPLWRYRGFPVPLIFWKPQSPGRPSPGSKFLFSFQNIKQDSLFLVNGPSLVLAASVFLRKGLWLLLNSITESGYCVQLSWKLS